ncbi:MAG: late competence development ComFB family protein [Clostridiaceae bacterium]|nr:late competence development ComFB family protein [Clostridiaceae bacterium]
MQLKNYMEEVVASVIKRVLKDANCCTCEKCINDVTAIALNNLPPRYIVTEEGELYLKFREIQQQYEVDAIAAILRAAEIVKKNPRHA